MTDVKDKGGAAGNGPQGDAETPKSGAPGPKGGAKGKGVAGSNEHTAAAAEPIDENKLIAERRSKLAALRESSQQAGTPVFPNDFRRNALSAQLHAEIGRAHV